MFMYEIVFYNCFGNEKGSHSVIYVLTMKCYEFRYLGTMLSKDGNGKVNI